MAYFVVRTGQLHKIAGFARVAWFWRRGTQKQALDYCAKGEQSKHEWRKDGCNGPNFGKNAAVTDYGEVTDKKEAQRTDLALFDEMLRTGATDEQLRTQGFVGCLIRYPKYVDKVRLEVKPVFTEFRKFYMLYGPPGIGKTKWAFEHFPDLYEVPIQTQKDSALWFDGYSGQKEILFDDFSGEIPLNSLLKIADVYLRKVPIKGSFRWLTASIMIFSSNRHPREWYQWTGRSTQEGALRRRFVDYGEIIALSEDEKLERVSPDSFWPYVPPDDDRVRYAKFI